MQKMTEAQTKVESEKIQCVEQKLRNRSTVSLSKRAIQNKVMRCMMSDCML